MHILRIMQSKRNIQNRDFPWFHAFKIHIKHVSALHIGGRAVKYLYMTQIKLTALLYWVKRG